MKSFYLTLCAATLFMAGCSKDQQATKEGDVDSDGVPFVANPSWPKIDGEYVIGTVFLKKFCYGKDPALNDTNATCRTVVAADKHASTHGRPPKPAN